MPVRGPTDAGKPEVGPVSARAGWTGCGTPYGVPPGFLVVVRTLLVMVRTCSGRTVLPLPDGLTHVRQGRSRRWRTPGRRRRPGNAPRHSRSPTDHSDISQEMVMQQPSVGNAIHSGALSRRRPRTPPPKRQRGTGAAIEATRRALPARPYATRLPQPYQRPTQATPPRGPNAGTKPTPTAADGRNPGPNGALGGLGELHTTNTGPHRLTCLTHLDRLTRPVASAYRRPTRPRHRVQRHQPVRIPRATAAPQEPPEPCCADGEAESRAGPRPGAPDPPGDPAAPGTGRRARR